MRTRVPLVACDTFSRPKNAGWLGVHDLIVWNTTSIGKYVQNVASKMDCLWVRL